MKYASIPASKKHPTARKSHHFKVLRSFDEQIFCQDEAKSAGILCVFRAFLTKYWQKDVVKTIFGSGISWLRDEAKIEKHFAEAERLKKSNAARHKKLAELESAEILDFIRENGITFEQLMSLKKDIKSDSETVLQQNYETETVEADADIFSEGSLFDFAVPDDDYGENEDN